jgi:SAM-dependent methyltransferase
LNSDSPASLLRKQGSYTSGRLPARRKFQEAWDLYRWYRQRAERGSSVVFDECESAREQIEALLGQPLKGLSVLDVGPGSFLAYSHYFAVDNAVTAIDSDIIPVGFSPLPYLRMFRINGAWRTTKTIGRKILGIDRAELNALKKRIGARKFRPVRVLHGDVCHAGIADGSFDVVYCRSVMQHIMEPGTALTEMARIVKPGGVLYISVHLYTSHNGAQPFRTGDTDHPEDLFWAHLRPALNQDLGTTAVLNRLRLSEWKALFQSICPGYLLEIRKSSHPRAQELADMYVASGELAGYTCEELTAHELVFTWKKSS